MSTVRLFVSPSPLQMLSGPGVLLLAQGVGPSLLNMQLAEQRTNGMFSLSVRLVRTFGVSVPTVNVSRGLSLVRLMVARVVVPTTRLG